MGQRGPAKMPTALRIATGNLHKEPTNENEPTITNERPTMPGHLAPDAVEEWERIVPIMEAMGTLSTDSGPALEMYCESYANWRAAKLDIAANGLVVASPHGSKKNPAFDVATKCAEIMLKCLREFGLTPSSRTGIKVKVDREEVDLDSFVSKKLNMAATE